MLTHKPLLVEELIKSQNNKCAICNEPLPEARDRFRLDRIIRGEDGGKYVKGNCRLICIDCDLEKEGNPPKWPIGHLRNRIKTRYKQFKSYQEDFNRRNRQLRTADGDIKGTTPSPYMDADRKAFYLEDLNLFEARVKESEKELTLLVHEVPEWEWMKYCPGLSEITVAYLLSLIDIDKSNTPSSLYNFFGFTKKDAAGSKGRNPGKGVLRAPLYAALSITLIRKTSPYRAIYGLEREKLEQKGREKGIHGGALFRTVKLWMDHLWRTWREHEGLSTVPPYSLRGVKNYEESEKYHHPRDFGWPSV